MRLRVSALHLLAAAALWGQGDRFCLRDQCQFLTVRQGLVRFADFPALSRDLVVGRYAPAGFPPNSNVQTDLMLLYPGLLILELPGAPRDYGTTAVTLTLPTALVLLCYKEHCGVELFCGITPLFARPTTEALRGISRGPGQRRGARRSARTPEELLHGIVVAGRAQERRADGGALGSG
jgi:hypothetical protein